jgi:hypothetical protein
MFRLFKSALFPLLLVVIFITLGFWLYDAVSDDAKGATQTATYRKEKLPRLDPLYEIVNDNGDHGNYIEFYRVPLPDGRSVFCVVYSDQIQKSGGGAGMSCDWQNAKLR